MKRAVPKYFTLKFGVDPDKNYAKVYSGAIWDMDSKLVSSYEQAKRCVIKAFEDEWKFYELKAILDWLQEHETAYKDFLDYFDYPYYNYLKREGAIPKITVGEFRYYTSKTLEDVYEWIEKQENLARDFEVNCCFKY